MFFSKPIDVVCGMSVSKDISYKSEYKGKMYYFCALSCKQDFERNPERYAK